MVRSTCQSFRALVIAVAILSPVASVYAQDLGASIVGVVRDDNGGVLPGVAVTATSPSLQVASVVGITDADGAYRLTPLPIGTYAVSYQLSGFQKFQRDGVRLTAGFAARIDVVLKLGSLEETITVSGASPVVDTTTSAIATQFTRQTLELTPTGRVGLYSLMSQMPSVRSADIDVGGNMVVKSPVGITSYGQLGDAWVVVEGVSTQSPKTDIQSGGYYDYGSMEEVRAEIVGSDASAARKGLKMSIITKSGGNDMHGSLYGNYTSDRFQSNNVTDELRAQGITHGAPVVHRYDVSGDLGGRIIRDRLWFYGTMRKSENVDIPLGGVMPDGSPAITPHKLTFMSGKLSYQMSPKHQFIAFGQRSIKDDVFGVTKFVPWESRTLQHVPAYVSKGEWRGVISSTLAASMQYGYWGFSIPYASSAPDKVSTNDIRTMYRTGDNNSAGKISNEHRHHTRGTLTWYAANLFLGNHEFKSGFDYMDAAINPQQVHRASGDYYLVFNNNVPYQLQTLNTPVDPRNPTHVADAYVTDTWGIGSRVTANLGVRFSHDNGFAPEQCKAAGAFSAEECFPLIQLPVWNSLAPRLSLSYDLFGDGKTALKAGWGRYNHMRGSDEVVLANRASTTTTTWTWRDADGNRAYTPGEVNLDPNGPDFVSIAGVADMVPNPAERQPKTDEFTVSLERQVAADFAVRVAGIYHHVFDIVRLQNNLRPYESYNIPITNPDPGDDGVVGNADDPGTFLTYWDYPASLRGRQFQQGMYVNDPNASQNFKTIELAATKRLSGGWQMMASYSATKKHIPYVTNIGGGNDYPLTTMDPNAEINAADNTWDWQGQLSGAYQFRWNIMGSVNYQHRSGKAFARTVLVSGGQQIPSIVLRAEPIGGHRLDNVNIIDVRLEKSLNLGAGQKVQLQVNLFNALNSSTAVTVTERAGPAFLQPGGNYTSILPPRIVAFSATYRF